MFRHARPVHPRHLTPPPRPPYSPDGTRSVPAGVVRPTSPLLNITPPLHLHDTEAPAAAVPDPGNLLLLCIPLAQPLTAPRWATLPPRLPLRCPSPTG